jgi:hypothetical protein
VLSDAESTVHLNLKHGERGWRLVDDYILYRLVKQAFRVSRCSKAWPSAWSPDGPPGSGAPAGTVAVIAELETTLKAAAVPFNVTLVGVLTRKSLFATSCEDVPA